MGIMTKEETDCSKPEKGNGIHRLLILGYYDGAEDGIVQLAEAGPHYRFDWLNSELQPDSVDRRTYSLRPFPQKAFEELVRLIGAYRPPEWPVWFPIWKFDSEAIRHEVNEGTEQLLALAGPIIGTLTTNNPFTFTEWTVRWEDVHAANN